jgi:hypothetical protein
MADAEDLKSSGDFSSCGFDSHPGHHFAYTSVLFVAVQSAEIAASPRVRSWRGRVGLTACSYPGAGPNCSPTR